MLKAKVRTAEFSPKYCFEAQQPIHRRVSVERGHLPHQICAGSLQNIQLFPFKFPSFPKVFQLPIEYRDWVCLHYFLWQCISHPKHSFFKIHILPYVTFAFLPITLLLCALVLELLNWFFMIQWILMIQWFFMNLYDSNFTVQKNWFKRFLLESLTTTMT